MTRAREKQCEAYDRSVDHIRRHHRAAGDRFPTIGQGSGYALGANDNWLAGFWTGLLWLVYAATGDGDVRAHAESLLPTFARRLDEQVHITHDLGFLFTLSARAQWQLARDEAARQLALRAAAELVRRYRPAGCYLQAWGAVADAVEGGRAIVDTMMNLPLLFWAAREMGERGCHDAAAAHADTTRRHLLRPDGASYHTFFFDQETGAPLGPRTHQGYADDSLWARGQAWAIYGFALAAEWTGDRLLLDAASRAARCWLAELLPGSVPPWDLRLPDSAAHYPDSSAGAIAAAGLLRLARLAEDQAAGEFRAAGLALVDTLVDNCFELQPESVGLLRHGTYHVAKGLGLDTYLICGDYFFLEALACAGPAPAEGANLIAAAPDFWGVEEWL